MKRSSTRVLYVAIAANIAIALSKYAAAAITGSSAMLAERSLLSSSASACSPVVIITRSVRLLSP